MFFHVHTDAALEEAAYRSAGSSNKPGKFSLKSQLSRIRQKSTPKVWPAQPQYE